MKNPGVRISKHNFQFSVKPGYKTVRRAKRGRGQGRGTSRTSSVALDDAVSG